MQTAALSLLYKIHSKKQVKTLNYLVFFKNILKIYYFFLYTT